MNAKLIFASLVALALPVVAQSAEAQGGAAGQDPVKVLVFLTQRSDRTRDAVMSYYVDHHSKLARRLLPPINHYTLNFTRPETAGIPPTAKPLDFSMVTEITFQSETSYAEFIGLTQVPEVRQPIDADEKNMTDQPQTRMVRVDEVVIPGGGTAMGSSDPVKALVFLTPKPGLTRDQVMDYYVNKHTKLVRRLLPMINNYTLNFTRSETAFVPATAPPSTSAWSRRSRSQARRAGRNSRTLSRCRTSSMPSIVMKAILPINRRPGSSGSTKTSRPA